MISAAATEAPFSPCDPTGRPALSCVGHFTHTVWKSDSQSPALASSRCRAAEEVGFQSGLTQFVSRWCCGVIISEFYFILTGLSRNSVPSNFCALRIFSCCPK